MSIKAIKIFLILASLGVVVFLIFFMAGNKNQEELPGEVTVLKFEFTNTFLIPLCDGYLLIDNAYEKEYEQFLAFLNERKIDLHEIKYVLLTHHHDDHVGFLNQMSLDNPEVRIILHKKTADLLLTGSNNKNNGGGIVNKRIYALFRLKQMISPKWDLSFPPYVVRERDIILEKDFHDLSDLLGINLKVIYTPGHSSDSVTYVYKDEYAFCGDLASNFLNWAGARYLTLFNEDISLVYSSWKKIIDFGVETIIPAHGNPYNIENLTNNLHAHQQENAVAFF